MKTIYKYPLAITDIQDVTMPSGARILAVASQRDSLCVWAHVDPGAPVATYKFRIVGTGHPLDTSAGYIGTVVIDPFVWHVFLV